MDWYDERGETVTSDRWANPDHRTLQYVAASTPENEAFNRILLIIHGVEAPTDVVLPTIDGVSRYVSLWSSADEKPDASRPPLPSGAVVPVAGTSMHLFRAE